MDLRKLGEDILCRGFKYRGWFPSKPSNPSKLELHYWDGAQWNPTHSVTFVPSLDWGASEAEMK